MSRIGIRELRQHASRYLERVRHGETIQVTDNGTLVAELVPIGGARTVRERLLRDGLLIAAARSFEIPQPVPTDAGSPSSAEILDELRRERL